MLLYLQFVTLQLTFYVFSTLATIGSLGALGIQDCLSTDSMIKVRKSHERIYKKLVVPELF